MDVLHAFIIDRVTQQPLVALAEPAKITDLTGLRRNGWNFNFRSLFIAGCTVYKVTYEGSLQGLVAFYNDIDLQAVKVVNAEVAPHNIGSISKSYIVGPTLFAIAAQYSFNCGQEGFIFLDAKTNLIECYHRKIGARLTMPPLGMGIFPEQSRILIKRYIKA